MDLGHKKALVTGGAGLIGSHIARELVKHCVEEVVVLDNLTRGTVENLAWAASDDRVRLVRGDIRDRGLLAEVMSGVAVVFHQAAIRISQCADDPRLALEVLVDGTFNVLEEAVQAGVEKVVAASSASAYGMADEFPTTELQHPYNNRTLYGAAKCFNEGQLRSFHEMYGLDYVALRYFNVYGPGMDAHGAYTEVLIRWMERIAARRAPLVFGDGTQTVDFVYVGDVARANVLAAQAHATDEVCNVASGTETSLNELAVAMLCLMGSDLQPEYLPARKVNPVPRRLADTRKAESVLDFRAQVPLQDGLARLVDWWYEQATR